MNHEVMLLDVKPLSFCIMFLRFIRVTLCILFYHWVRTYHSLYPFMIERCLGCLQFGAMMNKAAVNLLVQVFLRTEAFILEGKYKGVELLDQWCSVLLETSISPPKVDISFRFTSSSHPWQHLVLLVFSPIVYLPAVFICISLLTNDEVFFGHLYILNIPLWSICSTLLPIFCQVVSLSTIKL